MDKKMNKKMNKLTFYLILKIFLCVNRFVSSIQFPYQVNNLNNSSSINLLNHSSSVYNSLNHPSFDNLLSIENASKFGSKNEDSICNDIILSSDLYEQHCLCTRDQFNLINIDCDEMPILADHNLVINSFVSISKYSQSNAGLHLLTAPLFTNINGQLQMTTLDLSRNNLKKLVSRIFDGVEMNLEFLNLSHNLLGQSLNPIFSTNEFLELKNLKSLNLAYNKLRILDSNLFIGLIKLNDLNLEGNHLTTIPTSSLKVLDKLVKLSIGNNLIVRLENGDFPSSQSTLMLLNLTYNRIESIASDSFTHLNSLIELYLSNNHLKDFKINELNSLEILDLSENHFKSIPNTLKLKKLRKLSLAGNRITTIEENDFIHLTRLEYIDLSKNLIRSVSSQSFQYLNDLRVLNLATNSISKQSDLNFNLLRNQMNLDILDLSDNKINFFPFQLLINQKNLKKLFLDYNYIEDLTNEMLQSLENLEELSISFNLINELKDGLFYYNPKLKLLNLHGNKIQTVNDNVFIGCSDNLLGLDISYNDLSDVPKLVMPKLIILNLSLNQFKELNRDSFINLPSLIYLNLSNTIQMSNDLLVSIPNSIFQNNRLLEFLDLSNNNVDFIEYGAFKNLSLTKLNLSKNKLKELDISTFEELIDLENLDLSSNQISFIKNGAFDELPKLKSLNLSKNRLQAFRSELFTATRTQLEHLDLCDNSINYLYPNSFNIHRKLRTLLICSNNLNYFPTELISTIGSLEEIDLSSNRLKSLDTNNFSNLLKLKKLKLANNQINSIGSNVFHNLTRLNYLDLSDNSITSLDSNSLRNLLRLNLNLANNQLSGLESDLFDLENVAILNELNLANNNLTDFPLDALRKQATNLLSLDVSSNQISHLPTNTDLLVSLKQLDISSNPLSEEAIRVLFTEPKSIKHLNVANTKITEFKFSTIETPFLSYLNISGNHLKTINSSLFEKISLLEVLDLSRNSLVDLKQFTDIWYYLPNLRTLNLAHNLFKTIQKDDFLNLDNLVSLDVSNLKQLIDLDCESIAKLNYLTELMIYNYTMLKNYELQECFSTAHSKLSKLFIEIKFTDLKGHLFNSYSTKLNELLLYGPKLNKISTNFLYGIRSKHLDLTLFNTSIKELSLNVFNSLSLKCEIHFNVYSSNIFTTNEFLFTNHNLAELNNKQLNVKIDKFMNVTLPCDCSIETVYKMMRTKHQFALNGQRKSIFLSSLIDQFDNLTCNYPTNLVGFKLSEIDLNDGLCSESAENSGSSSVENNNYTLINKEKLTDKTDLIELSTNSPTIDNKTTTTSNYNLNHDYDKTLNENKISNNYENKASNSYDNKASNSYDNKINNNYDNKINYNNQQNSHVINQDHLLTKSSIRKNKNNLKLKTSEIKSNQVLSSLSFTKVDTIIIGSTVGSILFILILMIICCFGMRIKSPSFDQTYFNYANSGANLFGAQPFVQQTRNQSSLESCTCMKASCNQSSNNHHHQTNHSPYSSSLNNSLLNFSPIYQQQTDLEPMTMFYMK